MSAACPLAAPENERTDTTLSRRDSDSGAAMLRCSSCAAAPSDMPHSSKWPLCEALHTQRIILNMLNLPLTVKEFLLTGSQAHIPIWPLSGMSY